MTCELKVVVLYYYGDLSVHQVSQCERKKERKKKLERENNCTVYRARPKEKTIPALQSVQSIVILTSHEELDSLSSLLYSLMPRFY